MSGKTAKNAERIAAKKAAVLGTGEKRKKNRVAFLAMAACAALVLGGSAYFLSKQPPEGGAVSAGLAPEELGEITLPVSTFQDGKARYYEHRTAGGVNVRFFVLKSSDGVIRAAFDACDSCWRAGKGYHQEGDQMVCDNCRMKFDSVKVNEVKGGCNPAPLQREVRGEQVVIRVADIEAGASYFDLAGES